MSIITPVEERRGIVEIAADGAVFARIRKQHFARRPLEPGDEIDTDRYMDAMAALQFPDAYEAALSALDFSARSAREIRDSLRRKGYVDAAVDSAVERLRESRLIDDRRYAERITQTQSTRPVGIYAVKRKLRAKGISEQDAEEALESFDDDQQRSACRAAAGKLFKRYEGLPPREARAKLSQALARRGFGWDAVSDAVESLLSEDFDD